MLDLWNTVSLQIFDPVLGWILRLPSVLTLALLALFTSGFMVLLRPLLTNQDRLRRVAEDRDRVKVLNRDAKKSRDRPALERHRTTGTMLSMRALMAEGLPLLVALLPIALLATWAMSRVEFHPPTAGEEIEVTAFANLAAEGEIMHMVPQPGVEAVNGWVQPITLRANHPSWWDRLLVTVHLAEAKMPEPDAVAVWKVKGEARAEPYVLLIRFREQTIKRDLLIGQPIYSPHVQEETLTTQIAMQPVTLLGLPGLGEYLPAWLVGYLVIVIPLVFVLKWLLKIY
jgi:uncharacterized membrane protein (DUF106 family)